MYVTNIFNALNNYPHQLRFEPVRDADCVRRRNWSPGYYEDADAALDHHLDAPAEEKEKEQATGELEMADA